MRYQPMFLKNPPDIVAQFAERVPMVKGRCDPKASTAYELLLACLVYR